MLQHARFFRTAFLASSHLGGQENGPTRAPANNPALHVHSAPYLVTTGLVMVHARLPAAPAATASHWD